jgi:hypothetical protein
MIRPCRGVQGSGADGARPERAVDQSPANVFAMAALNTSAPVPGEACIFAYRVGLRGLVSAYQSATN